MKSCCHNSEAGHRPARRSLKAGHPLGTHRPLGRAHQVSQREEESKVRRAGGAVPLQRVASEA